jgi:hypothetical protein
MKRAVDPVENVVAFANELCRRRIVREPVFRRRDPDDDANVCEHDIPVVTSANVPNRYERSRW